MHFLFYIQSCSGLLQILGFNEGFRLSLQIQLQSMLPSPLTGLQIRVRIGKLFSLFLIQNMCCGYSKEGSFQHPKHMFK